jgi:hypothetical protein
MISKPKINNPKVIREGGWKNDLLAKHGSEKIGKCIVRVEKLRPQQLINNFKIMVNKIDINTILDQQGDVVVNRLRTCRSSCKTCPDLIVSNTFYSSVSGRAHSVINHSGEQITCKTQNVVYVLTCKKCHYQYVGESCIPLHERINIHRTSKSGCEIFIDHFSSCCQAQSFYIQVIEVFEGDGYTNGKVDEDMRRIRREREDWWMKTLRTIYPYGLNDQHKKQHSTSSVGLHFFPLTRYAPRPSVRSRNKNGNSTKKTPQCIYTELESLITSFNPTPQYAHIIRKKLSALDTKTLKTIWNLTAYNNIFHDDKFVRWQDLVLDIIDTKIYKPLPAKDKKPPSKFKLRIQFVNKGLDFIKIRKIIKSDEVTSLLPTGLPDDDKVPSVLHKLEPTIRNKIFNYRQTVNDIDFSGLNTLGTDSEECDCKNSSFLDAHHNHIVTGDLRIIKNTLLRKLFAKGPNFREPKPINLENCYNAIAAAVESCAEHMATAMKIDPTELLPWSNMIYLKVRNIITPLKPKIKNTSHKTVLKQDTVKDYLSELHSKYVIVPIDKAANNVAIICKKFYIKRLLDEVGFLHPNPTYTTITNKTESDVICDNIEYTERLGMETDEEDLSLPIMYWTPKMHKTPTGARFIIASKTCSTKKISKSVSNAFKVILKQIENFHHKSTFYSQYKKYWVVQNSMQIIADLDKINKRKKAKSISTFDFATLYTKIPHEQLIETLEESIDFAFNGGNKKFLKFNDKYAYWSSKGGGQHFTKGSLKIATKHLILSCYFKVGDKLFRQKIGMPMGIDPAPFWANIYLYNYEAKYITGLTKSNNTSKKIIARKFHATSRFIDDLCALNDGGEFGKNHKEIYSREMELKKEHEGHHATFLDLDINKTNKIFIYKLFDKRDEFPFSIVKMPFLSSNIPYNIFYNTILSEILRIARCSLLYADFLYRAKKLCHRMRNQGADVIFGKSSLLRFIKKHSPSFKKFNVPFRSIVEACYN